MYHDERYFDNGIYLGNRIIILSHTPVFGFVIDRSFM